MDNDSRNICIQIRIPEGEVKRYLLRQQKAQKLNYNISDDLIKQVTFTEVEDVLDNFKIGQSEIKVYFEPSNKAKELIGKYLDAKIYHPEGYMISHIKGTIKDLIPAFKQPDKDTLQEFYGDNWKTKQGLNKPIKFDRVLVTVSENSIVVPLNTDTRRIEYIIKELKNV